MRSQTFTIEVQVEVEDNGGKDSDAFKIGQLTVAGKQITKERYERALKSVFPGTLSMDEYIVCQIHRAALEEAINADWPPFD